MKSTAENMSNEQVLSITDISKKRPIVFREQRIDIPNNVVAKCTFKTFYEDSIELRIENISRFGVKLSTINKDPNFSIERHIKNVDLEIDGFSIFRGPISIVNERTTESGHIVFGAAIDEGEIELDKVRAMLGDDNFIANISQTKKVLELADQIEPSFKVLVADLNTLFQDLRFRLISEEQEISKKARDKRHAQKLEEHAISIAISIYTPLIHDLFKKFSILIKNYDNEKDILHRRYFRANFHPVVLGAPFVSRAFSKPLGYAGDYGLMMMFYDYEDIGGNLFEKFIHRFSCLEPVAVANKNRVEYLASELLSFYDQKVKKGVKKIKISSIACGPGKEIEMFLESLDLSEVIELEINLLDQEEEALDHCTKRIRKLLSGKTKNIKINTFKEDAVLGIIKEKPFVEVLKNSDVIISAGLFDYLSDRVSTKLIDSFKKILNVDGIIYVGNVAKNNPDTFSMAYFMEWSLVLRDEHDLLKLSRLSSETDAHFNSFVQKESLGLNLFLKIEKRG